MGVVLVARCGHTGQCNCVINPGPGVQVRGIGTPEQPYEVAARLSSESGNRLRFDGQGALYAGGSGGGEQGCGVSVAGLPEEHLAIGRGGAGRLLAPDHTLRSLTRAIDLSLPAVHVRCRPLSDGTPVAFPALSIRNQTGDYAQLQQWPELQPDHADYWVPNLDVSAYKTMPIFAGWDRTLRVERDWTTYNPGGGLDPIRYNEGNLGARWGFFGFGERQQAGGLTLSEVLSHVGLRTVVMIEMAATTPQFLALVLEMIRRHCAQEAVIVAAQDLQDLEAFTEENIATMLWLPTPESVADNPAGQVADAGVGWVNITSEAEDSDITTYTSAGLDVILSTLTRHWHWGRVDDVGARGCLSDDPVYMMGFDDPHMHRVASGHSSLRHHGVLPGQLSYRTDDEAYWPPWSRGEKLMGWGPDGTSTGPVPLLPPLSGADADQWVGSEDPLPLRSMSGYGLLIPRSGADIEPPNGVFDILAGWLCPIQEPVSYAIEYQVSFCSDPDQGGRNIGIFFGLPDDRSYWDHMEAGTSFWQATLQWNGILNLRRYENGEIVEEDSVDTETTIKVGSWYRHRVVVDDVGVSLERVSFEGEVLHSAQLDGEAHGPYWMLFKNELGGDGVRYPFTSGHRQLWVRSPFEGQDPDPLNQDGSYPWESGGRNQDPDGLLLEEARVEPLERVPQRGVDRDGGGEEEGEGRTRRWARPFVGDQ